MKTKTFIVLTSLRVVRWLRKISSVLEWYQSQFGATLVQLRIPDEQLLPSQPFSICHGASAVIGDSGRRQDPPNTVQFTGTLTQNP